MFSSETPSSCCNWHYYLLYRFFIQSSRSTLASIIELFDKSMFLSSRFMQGYFFFFLKYFFYSFLFGHITHTNTHAHTYIHTHVRKIPADYLCIHRPAVCERPSSFSSSWSTILYRGRTNSHRLKYHTLMWKQRTHIHIHTHTYTELCIFFLNCIK